MSDGANTCACGLLITAPSLPISDARDCRPAISHRLARGRFSDGREMGRAISFRAASGQAAWPSFMHGACLWPQGPIGFFWHIRTLEERPVGVLTAFGRYSIGDAMDDSRNWLRGWLLVCLACLATLAGCASGPTHRELDASIRAAESTLSNVQETSRTEVLRAYLKRAKAVFIVSSGEPRAIALARSDAEDGWSGPAFYNITEISASGKAAGGSGFAAVRHRFELVALAMSDKAMDWLVAPRLPGKTDLNIIAAGALRGRSAVEADLVVFATREGAREMAEFGTPLITVDRAANQSFYGHLVTPADILINQSVDNPEAVHLQDALAAVE